ncbi:L-threonylcarbamoyladenylate synthase [Alteripontixanthobacter maritimus]|uniref:Threonylcarbamoyl-AMP synthase n=1 Tax=Alteripontixanthobacter maritimus TaxID=2161824 RepID=A0A369Q8B3_9SPHN|nr:L-threonylcarbamoyladenylate synthase [Alteripontixanthobacter maritimus]RDC61133.1 L-threonylcarbamoyladenylate synthase [Alteripontixanthobacter maritimus]
MGGKDATERLHDDAAGIARAIELLCAGHPVALPTETVYGLAARTDDAQAVAGIYRAKGRPDFNPLIVHVPDITAAKRLTTWDERAVRLAAQFWPGPLSLVLPTLPNSGIAPAITAGLNTVALRCPAHPVMRAVLGETGPLAAPSANRSGGVSPTTADHVLASLDGRIAAVVDGGPSGRGIESTILALREGGRWEILRPGPVTHGDIAGVLGMREDAMTEGTSGRGVEAPGQLASHYAPGKPVRLGAVQSEEDEFHIGFGDVPGDRSLSPSGDLAEAAARLYDCLHIAALAPETRIAVAPIPERGIGAAINDRLQRAAAPVV